MGWGEYLVIADTPELGNAWEDLVRTQCPSVEVTALPALEPEYWAALFGVECSVVEVCNLCGRLTCAGCGPSMVVFVLDKAHVTACEGCLGHGPEHYAGPGPARGGPGPPGNGSWNGPGSGVEAHFPAFRPSKGSGTVGGQKGPENRKYAAPAGHRGAEVIPAHETEACCRVDALKAHGRKLAGESGALFVALALLMVISWGWEYPSLSWRFHAVVIMDTWAAGAYCIPLQYWLLPRMVNQSVERHRFTRDHPGPLPLRELPRVGSARARSFGGVG